jgi:geranylgeranyl diphosphate synthase, type II
LITLASEYLDCFEKELDLLFLQESPLFQAARYMLVPGGKRLRPLLMLMTSEIFGSHFVRKAMIPACALEMVHTYSLIHDDLPCMDDDDWRRGRPTLHKIYGEGHAVLTGDFLLTYAFELLSDAPNLSDAQKISLVRLLSKRAGGFGMIGGQANDLYAQSCTISWEQLLSIHCAKTGALFVASIEAGAIVGEASPDELTILSQVGKELGLAYQIIDDLLDAEQEKDLMTNATCHLGKEKAYAFAEELFQSALDRLPHLPYSTKHFADFAYTLVHREL